MEPVSVLFLGLVCRLSVGGFLLCHRPRDIGSTVPKRESPACATCSAARRASVMHAAPRTSAVLSSHLDTEATARFALLLVNFQRLRSHEASRILQRPHHCWTSFLGHRQLAQDLQGLSDATTLGPLRVRGARGPTRPPEQTVGSLHLDPGLPRSAQSRKSTFGLFCARDGS